MFVIEERCLRASGDPILFFGPSAVAFMSIKKYLAVKLNSEEPSINYTEGWDACIEMHSKILCMMARKEGTKH